VEETIVAVLVSLLTKNELEKLDADEITILKAKVLHELANNPDVKAALRSRVEAALGDLKHKPDPWP
jgi:hypothetical protein